MAKFVGFTCDNEGCGAIHPDEEKIVEKVTVKGMGVDGESTRDLCPKCGSKVVDNLPNFKSKGDKKSDGKKPASGTTPAPGSPSL